MWRLLATALGRDSRSSDAMREAAAQTTVILLAQNEKFELFMRQKVEELQARVTAQGARLSAAAETEESDLLDELPELAETPVFETDEAADLPLDEVQLDASPVTDPEPDEVPDYLALMRGEAADLAEQTPGDREAVISLADQAESVTVETEAADEEDQSWDTPLAAGQKEAWS